jgi:aryl-alcohol dehydrogenase-like predicted oxidoreductase
MECEASLRRLGVDCIDLYQIHWPDPRTPAEDTFAELVKLRDEGKVRYLGVSNFSREQLETAKELGGIVSNQPQYNLLDRAIEKEVLPWCGRNDVGVIAYSPMGRGILTGKVDRNRRFSPTDHRSGLPWFQPENRPKVLEALEKVRPIAEAHRTSLANLAVAWVVGEPGITAAIVGARDETQAVENARASDLRLTDGERAEIRRAFERL